MQRGELDAALREADNGAAAYRSKNPEWAARFRVVEARILMMKGAYTDSLRLANQPLPGSLVRSDTEVEQKMVQGLSYDYLQQMDDADRTISEAEELAIAIHSSLLGAVEQTRGNLELDRNDLTRAGSAFRNAAEAGRKHNLPRVELGAFASLGLLAMRLEHYDEAVDRFRQALEKSRAIGAADIEAKTLGNLGWSYWVIGDFENAEVQLIAAQKKAAQLGLVEDETYWLVSLADVYALQHRWKEADANGRKALEFAEHHEDKNTLSSCLNVLSRVALATGNLADAELFNRDATKIESAGLDQSGVDSSRIVAGRIAVARRDFPVALAAFRKVLADPKAETPLKWEAHARLAEMYAAQRQPSRAEHEFSVAIRTVQNARASITSNEYRVSFLSSAIDFYDDYVNFLIEQKRPMNALKIADLSRAQVLEQSLSPANSTAATKTVNAQNPQETARRLNATLLFYWLGQQKSWLWVITPGKTSLVPLAAANSELAGLVNSYRESFTDPRDPLEAGNADGKKLYSTLVQPTEKLIGKNSRVVILPDGALNSLNFETLIVPNQGSGFVSTNPETNNSLGFVNAKPNTRPQAREQAHYWIEDATVLTANSLSRLARSSPAVPPGAGNILVMGDALAASPDFPPLPEAGKEVGLLEKYFGESRRLELTGKNATATAFLASQPEKFSYLHFATHGTASQLRPLESAVILSPDKDSYKLYARDVVQHPLSAYLVTISACNGAGTKTYAGEGLVGLSWAFLRAGAHNVIAGLWEVSNASTPQLMDQLYKGIHEGEDPATALRKAKLTLLHSTGNYRKPFYWAPFLIYAGS